MEHATQHETTNAPIFSQCLIGKLYLREMALLLEDLSDSATFRSAYRPLKVMSPKVYGAIRHPSSAATPHIISPLYWRQADSAVTPKSHFLQQQSTPTKLKRWARLSRLAEASTTFQLHGDESSSSKVFKPQDAKTISQRTSVTSQRSASIPHNQSSRTQPIAFPPIIIPSHLNPLTP